MKVEILLLYIVIISELCTPVCVQSSECQNQAQPPWIDAGLLSFLRLDQHAIVDAVINLKNQPKFITSLTQAIQQQSNKHSWILSKVKTNILDVATWPNML